MTVGLALAFWASATVEMGASTLSVESQRFAQQEAVRIERETILSLVREHRRTASATWRQRLADAIYDESVAARVDPLMVAAIVARESSFKSRIVSRSGAVGLMQLRPFVARDIARRSEINWNGRQTLHCPNLNVRLGIQYFKELVDRFEGDERAALTAYNYGPSRVSYRIHRGEYAGSDYAENILALYDRLSRERSRG